MPFPTDAKCRKKFWQSLLKICGDHSAFRIALWKLPSSLRAVPGLKIEELKVLVAKCSKIEDLFIKIDCCYEEYEFCHQLAEVVSIIVGSQLSDTLVNLSLVKACFNVRHQEFGAKCLELGQMKKLKKVEIFAHDREETEEEFKDILREYHPDLTIVESRKQENFYIPADPYAKHDKSSGFWEIGCNRLSCDF